MTEKQKRFCDAYLANGCNARQAAISAGYSEKSANDANKWINAESPKNPKKFKPEIRTYIDEHAVRKHNKAVADADEIFKFWTRVMRGDERDTVVASNGKVVDVPPSIKDRMKASELRAKALGCFNQNINITGSVPVVITGADELED